MLQVLFLNTWGLRRQFEITNFLKKKVENGVDIICLSEVYRSEHIRTIWHKHGGMVHLNGYGYLVNQLPDYNATFVENRLSSQINHSGGQFYDKVGFGLCQFIHRSVSVHTGGDAVIFDPECYAFESSAQKQKLQWIVVEKNNQRYLVVHFHGLWIKGNTKGDAPERVIQSAKVCKKISYLVAKYCPDQVILGGDFNLDLDTSSLHRLEEGAAAAPLTNLIRSYQITSTRTHLFRDAYTPGVSQWADYVLVSKSSHVSEFTVCQEPVSDHAALFVGVR